MALVTLNAGLFLVATPIGRARDITLTALDMLESADILAAEDTRNARRLMDIHGIALNGRRIFPYHDHNGAEMRPKLLAAAQEGKSVVYVSDAGTPLIADPGFGLVQVFREHNLPVTHAPGASAVSTALVIAGQPTDRFIFLGFAPSKTLARQRFLTDCANVPSTLVLFESAQRLKASLSDMATCFGPDRSISICRELTKKFEEVITGTLAEVIAIADKRSNEGERPIKGEIVLVVGPPVVVELTEADLDAALLRELKVNRVKDAATEVAKTLGVSRKRAYDRALELKDS